MSLGGLCESSIRTTSAGPGESTTPTRSDSEDCLVISGFQFGEDPTVWANVLLPFLEARVGGHHPYPSALRMQKAKPQNSHGDLMALVIPKALRYKLGPQLESACPSSHAELHVISRNQNLELT